MKLPTLRRPTLKRSTPLLAALLIFAFFFQAAAIDHQFHVHASDVSQVVGVPGTSDHTLHCHGTSSCANSALSSPMAAAEAFKLPPAPRPIVLGLSLSLDSPPDAELPGDVIPPRA